MPDVTQTSGQPAYNSYQPISSAANIASYYSGLPVGFTQALIMHEGTTGVFPTPNNPFDITDVWAKLAGFGNIVTALWNDLGGGHGVAITNDPVEAIKAWWAGLSQFSNYSQFRSDIGTQAGSAYNLAYDLAKSGYAGGGNPADYARSIAALYEQLTGKSGYAPLQANEPITVQTPAPSGGNPAVSFPSPNGGGSQIATPTFSFGQGLLHLLGSAGIVLVALVLLGLGVYLISRQALPDLGKTAAEVVE